MTYQDHCTLPTEWLENIAQGGLGYMPELIRILVNLAMRLEREQHLGAGLYERSDERQGHANGYKPQTVAIRIGKITFDVPRCGKGVSTPMPWRKGCARNEP